MVVGEPMADRLMRSQAVERAVRDTGLTRQQVAAVLRGLADAEGLKVAATYALSETSYCPVQTSLARFLHDTAWDLEQS